jgi:hypothetical protein
MLLRTSFGLLGLAALAIGLMNFMLGPGATAGAFADMLRLGAPDLPPMSGLAVANADSEMRFYSVLWMAYGAIALWVVRDHPRRMGVLRGMLAIFWLGGLGRVISHFAAGPPHLLFQVLMWIELVLPPALFALSCIRLRAAPGDT